jgi:RHS repeat-associated protein
VFAVLSLVRQRLRSVALVAAVALAVQFAMAVVPLPSGLAAALISPAHAAPWMATGARPASPTPPPANITPSGADAPYPQNNMLDSVPTQSTVDNFDFERPSRSVGTPPTNNDFQTVPQVAGTTPTNYAFDDGLTGWTATGTTTPRSDATRGGWAELSSGTLTSPAFTVGADAENIVFDIGYLSASGTDIAYVYVLTGAQFDTATYVDMPYCSGCGRWSSFSINPAAYRGQTVKIRVNQVVGRLGVDRLRPETTLPGWQTTGGVRRVTEAGSNAYAELAVGAAATTAPFDVAAEAESVGLRLLGSGNASDCYHLYVLSGADFATSTLVAYCKTAPAGWSDVGADITAWRGQRVKLKVSAGGVWGIDDVGMKVEVPSWTLAGDAHRISDGTGAFVRANSATIVSAPVALASDAQNVVLRARTSATYGSVIVSALSGGDYTTAVMLKQLQLTGDGAWHTIRVGVNGQAGKTVKLRFETSYSVDLDDAGVVETVARGWSVRGGDAIVAGQDAGGSYLEPTPLASTLQIVSTPIDLGVVDLPGSAQGRFYSVSYDIGYAPGSFVRVYWLDQNGAVSQLFGEYVDNPTGLRTRLVKVYDLYGIKGRLRVDVYGGRVYEVGSNVARQQLREPYSRKVAGADTATGAFGHADTDIAPAGAAQLGYTRYYNAHSDAYGALGWRWTDSYDTRLYPGAGGDVNVVFGSGAEEPFELSNAGTYVPIDPRVHAALVRNTDGSYTYTTPTNLAYQFTAAGVLTRIADPNGRATTLSYNAAGRLSTVEATGGARLTRGYDAAGHLATITDPDGATTSYGYDSAGDLVTVTDPAGGVRRYTYDRHLLTSATDPTGATVFTNTFDAALRLTSQSDAAANTTAIGYGDPGAGATVVTDPLGQTERYYFDPQHRTTHAVDPGGYVTRNVYDTAGNLAKVVDPADHATTFSHDNAGNTTAVTDPLGAPVQLTYDTRHLPTIVTDARGNTTRLTYDEHGNLASSTDPLGNTTRSTYDATGNLVTETDPLGRATTHTYDPAGNRTSTTDPSGATWRWTYNASGRKLTATDPLDRTTSYTYGLLGQLIAEMDPAGAVTTYLYDMVGRLLRVEDHLQRRTSWRYDTRGLVTEKTDPAGSITHYGYDADQRLTSTTDPLGRTTSYTYDAAGRVATVADPAGHSTAYSYDLAGRLAAVSDPLGRTTGYGYDDAGRLTAKTLPNTAVWHYGYDPNGNLTTTTDPAGHPTTYTYDPNNQLAQSTDPAGHATAYTYDAAGQRIRTTDPTGAVTATSYDQAGRSVAVTDPVGAITSYRYDQAGQLTAVSDPLGKARGYTYDPTGRLLSTVDPLGGSTRYTYDDAGQTLTRTSAANRTWHYGYDPRGLQTTVTDPAGHPTAHSYDAAGQLVADTDPNGHTTHYHYDPAGNLDTMTDALGGAVRFGHDPAGQSTTVTDQRGATWTTAYTALGQPATLTDPLGRITTNEYNTLGQLTAVTDPRGYTTRTSYDASGRPTTTDRPEGGHSSYTYDPAGRTLSATSPTTGANQWAYDAAGHVTTATSPTGSIGYGYDLTGRRTSMTLPGNQTVGYGYNDAGQLTTLTDPADAVTTFGYDPDALPTTTDRPNGVHTSHEYSPDGKLAAVEHRTAGAVLARYTYTYDPAGNRISATGPAGAETYTHDPLNRLTAATYPDNTTAAYSYDPAGNRLTETTPAGTTGYTYDPAGQITTAGPVSYDHDPAGNLTRAGTRTYTYNSQNQLLLAATDTTTSRYTYDADGNRITTTTGGSTTNLLYDSADRLPELVQAGPETHLHADGPIATRTAGQPTTYPLADGLGSIRAVTDPTGAVTATTDYTAFGAPRTTNGPQPRFGYTGEPTDPTTGLTYLRARDLDTTLGRFTTADTIQPNAPGTQGYNRYTYTANNPTTWTDPTGHLVASGAERVAATTAAAAAEAAQTNALFCRVSIRICGRVGMEIVATVLDCVFNPICRDLFIDAVRTVQDTATGPQDKTYNTDGGRPVRPDPKAPVIAVPTPEPSAGGRPKPGPGTKENRKDNYVVRLQAQGSGVEESVVLSGSEPITVAQGIAGLEELKSKLSKKELESRVDCFRRAERFIRNGPAGGGIAPGGNPFPIRRGSSIRVDVEIIVGINFRE